MEYGGTSSNLECVDSWIGEGTGQRNEERGPGQFQDRHMGHGQEFYPTSCEEPGKILSHGVLRSEVLF